MNTIVRYCPDTGILKMRIRSLFFNLVSPDPSLLWKAMMALVEAYDSDPYFFEALEDLVFAPGFLAQKTLLNLEPEKDYFWDSRSRRQLWDLLSSRESKVALEVMSTQSLFSK